MLCAKFGWNWPILEKDVALHLNKLESPSPKMFEPSLVKIGPVILENFSKYRQCIFAILLCLPLEKGGAINLNKLKSPSSKDDL